MDKCLYNILGEITPSSSERARIDKLAQRVLRVVKKVAEEIYSGDVVLVEYEGSYAKDTWLSGELDLDLFIYYRRNVGVNEIGPRTFKIVDAAAKVLGARIERRYASHPYYTLVLSDGVEVDVVPAFFARDPGEIVTPVDRTRLHTVYVKKKLEENPGLKDHIRLLKKLAKVTGIYGAEQGVSGFSGYLCEVLVIHYGGLFSLLEDAARWRPWKTYIPDSILSKRFRAPLVVLDPVDARRNAAAAVSEEALSKFIAMARLSDGGKRGLCCIYRIVGEHGLSLSGKWVVVKARPRGVYSPQEAAGILDKTRRRVVKNAEKEGFVIGRSRIFAPRLTGKEGYLVFEVIVERLPPVYLHKGPPVYSPSSKDFIKKWVKKGKLPFILGSRWYVPVEHPYSSFQDFLYNILSMEKRFAFTVCGGGEASEYIERMLRYEAWIKCFSEDTP